MLFYDLLQVPIYEMRNDGRDNLLGALLIAGQFVIPEVSRGGRDTSSLSSTHTQLTTCHLHLFLNAMLLNHLGQIFLVAHF